MSNIVVIDFQQRGYQGKVYSGRVKGELARRDLGIDKLDDSDVVVQLIVPARLFSLTSSFFLGMFGPTLHKLRSKAAFKAKYDIKASPSILEEIDEYIDTELRRATFSR